MKKTFYSKQSHRFRQGTKEELFRKERFIDLPEMSSLPDHPVGCLTNSLNNCIAENTFGYITILILNARGRIVKGGIDFSAKNTPRP